MSTTPRLPARPSLEQLRKQAKEKLQQIRAAEPDATLADAQFALARDYGYESWPKLVQHVGSMLASGRLAPFEQLARDLFAGYGGDESALERLGAHFGDSADNERRRRRVRDRIDALRRDSAEATLDDVRLVVARQFGFETWSAFGESMSSAPNASTATTGIARPPFYRIDRKRRLIEPQPPLGGADWTTIFAVMKEHGLTGIASTAITDDVMPRLSRLDFVTTINAGGARQLTDQGLQHLAHMTQLQELDLSGWHSPLTDRGLEVLRHLRNLRRFSMCWPQRISDAGVANLAFAENLERVNLMGTPTGDGAIRALRGKAGLRLFNTGKLVTDAGLPLLHDFPVFEQWRGGEITLDLMTFEAQPNHLMIDGPFTDQGLAGLRGLDGVFGLGFFRHAHSFTGRGLAALSDFANLGFLGCQGDRCDDEAMRQIARIPKLRMLMGQGTVATDDGFAALSQSPTIEYIWGRECPNLSGRGFVALSAMPALRGLAVSCKFVDDEALRSLPHFPALTALMPMDVTDDGFRHVGGCEKLEHLWCMYCRDTGDIATGHIAGLRYLRTYYAGKTLITDRSLEILSRMRSLEKLEFWEVAAITDAGISALARLPNLKEITVEGSPNVTRRGMSVFSDAVRVQF
jgi:hypothetical protein